MPTSIERELGVASSSPEALMSTSSRFVWHDLMAKDVDAAKKFYGELLGWSYEGGKDGDPYVHITSKGKHIGGMMKLEMPGAPPHWLGYVSVDNVDQTVASVQKNGGKVYMPAKDIPKVGRFAVTADPQGAAFAPFHHTGEGSDQPETNDKPAPFTFCWDELLTKDAAAAAKFYEAVFGWKPEKVDMGGAGTYTLLKRPGVKDDKGMDKSAGGIMVSPPGAQHPPFWLAYIAVPNADAVAEKLTKLGGKVLNKPMDIPNVGRFFPGMDSQGATIAFLAPST